MALRVLANERTIKGQLLLDQNFQVGDKISLNYYYKATGPDPVELKEVARWLYLESDSGPETQRKMIADFKKGLSERRKKHRITTEPSTLMPGDQRWSSVYAATEDRQYRLATQNDLDKLRAGAEIAFVLVELSYTDKWKTAPSKYLPISSATCHSSWYMALL